MEDVWDCYGTRSEPLPGMEWWKTSETATALGRNHYQVWKTSGTATALGRNHYPVWNGGRRLRLLRHLVGTTTKYGMVEDVRDCYGTRSEPLPNVVTGGRDCYKVLRGWDGSERRLDSFKENVHVLQLLQVRQRGTWWRLRLVNKETGW